VQSKLDSAADIEPQPEIQVKKLYRSIWIHLVDQAHPVSQVVDPFEIDLTADSVESRFQVCAREVPAAPEMALQARPAHDLGWYKLL
jgi:hypothetical protein